MMNSEEDLVSILIDINLYLRTYYLLLSISPEVDRHYNGRPQRDFGAVGDIKARKSLKVWRS